MVASPVLGFREKIGRVFEFLLQPVCDLVQSSQRGVEAEQLLE